jgi:hypothetical protein
MSLTDDGGPAFPLVAPGPNESHTLHPGMSLRDWFAGQAIAGMFRHQGWINCVDDDQEEVARRAYIIADAMLAARKER